MRVLVRNFPLFRHPPVLVYYDRPPEIIATSSKAGLTVPTPSPSHGTICVCGICGHTAQTVPAVVFTLPHLLSHAVEHVSGLFRRVKRLSQMPTHVLRHQTASAALQHLWHDADIRQTVRQAVADGSWMSTTSMTWTAVTGMLHADILPAIEAIQDTVVKSTSPVVWPWHMPVCAEHIAPYMLAVISDLLNTTDTVVYERRMHYLLAWVMIMYTHLCVSHTTQQYVYDYVHVRFPRTVEVWYALLDHVLWTVMSAAEESVAGFCCKRFERLLSHIIAMHMCLRW